MKSFVIFAIICFSDPNSVTGISCLNFWENPITHYKSESKCLKASEKHGDAIIKEFENNNFEIQEFIMWCVPSRKKVDI